ncbi:hypothetical protein DSO57_1005956 [Entomophthora muscae]|uniref:Uncharacterized protein n=1 Tax=Entomophthora muscae TaxID=34485 RepID=A0ACC2TVG8_9FUNG|nr:hypothetical protein DSO57_1005956 [Entomophthora muscae]
MSFHLGWVCVAATLGSSRVPSVSIGGTSSIVGLCAVFATLGGRPLLLGLAFSAIVFVLPVIIPPRIEKK